MMLVDAGPLVALIHAGDRNHLRCKLVASRILPPLLTVS